MNQYHIYEAIGRGKHSTVYKGRKKKTIEYFAVKSVDKSQKNKVLHEVRILHSLDHANVLKFYSWYETSAHLWLVLEYCVGGNLMNLLEQDGKLPEDSLHDLACGLVRALLYLHSKGIIYCDLKPSNILLDENGITKLCDFGLARKLSDISKTPSSQLPQIKRGTPCYMAPELFQDGGVHSYASDFWALGCVLFECYAGIPPFVGKEFTQLVRSIISDPTPELPGTPSRPFINLINSLLIKDPAERMQWPELTGHAIWKTRFSAVPLPPQPAFDNMIEVSSRLCLSERNSDKPIQNKTPQKTREKDSKASLRQDENSNTGSRGHVTPIKGISSGRKAQMKGSGRTVDDKQKDISSNTKGVNLLRLSRIAKSNLMRENEKENYRRPLPNNSENDAELKVENTDMELDFNENNEDDTQDEADETDSTQCPESTTSTPNQAEGHVEEMDIDSRHPDPSAMVNTPFSDDSRTSDHEPTSEYEVAAMLPSDSPQLKTPAIKGNPGNVSDISKPSKNLSDILWHPSDLSVRPVMPSKKSDKGSDAIPSLSFDAPQVSDFVKMSKEQLDTFSSRIISIVSGNTASGEKQNVIRYLELLTSNAEAANILTNGPIMLVLVKMLRHSKASLLRAQLASLIGLLIRHSTFIGDELANSGILGALTDGLRDRQEKVRRFSMAALGELLFYISTQNEHARDNKPMESPSKDSRPSSCWQVTSPIISLVSSVLRNGEDDITQLYALRTIENISSQGGYWSARFASQDVITNLCYIFRAPGKQDSMRLTAGSCLARLVRFNPSSIQRVIEKLSFKDMASSLVKRNPREQQICLNILNMTLLESHMLPNVGRYLLTLVEDKNLVPNLVTLIEQGSEVLKGKTLIFVALLCMNGKRWLPLFFCNAKLLSTVDRLVKEKDDFVKQCLDALGMVVASTVPSLLESISGDIQQLKGGKRRGQMISLTSRNSSKNSMHLFPVVLHLLGCASLKRRVASRQVLQQLANLLKLAESPFQGRDDFQITLLRVLESIAEEISVVQESSSIFVSQILPSLSVIYRGNKDGDARFLCLKIFFDVMVILLDETSEKEKSENLKSISNSYFLPLYPSLIEDEDPIPVYAQKLLVMLIEYNHIKIADIVHMKIISQCFEFLLGDFSTANVNNLLLCLALTSAPELETKILSQLKVVRKIGSLLEFVCAKEMEDFIEPTLRLCRAFLLRSVGSMRGSMFAKEPCLLYENSSDGASAFDQYECIRDIMDFGENVGVLLELTRFNEINVADLASECLILLLKAAPREATTGFLTNLPKVSLILESWKQSISHLLLQRILIALGYSCRQYLSHAMILSISLPEISKIEGIVSQVKSSTIPALTDAASRAALELQRLPRCI
ncbi:serine/threonine-protein kinase RUNKEL-like [Nicotiana tabacum]|uniref:Serine/threonine-protein kinase RUNKEL-like n=1 Tax=Nicotiana tabacum TaxID=4097 RepID=A0AC58SPG8_TOBAC